MDMSLFGTTNDADLVVLQSAMGPWLWKLPLSILSLIFNQQLFFRKPRGWYLLSLQSQDRCNKGTRVFSRREPLCWKLVEQIYHLSLPFLSFARGPFFRFILFFRGIKKLQKKLRTSTWINDKSRPDTRKTAIWIWRLLWIWGFRFPLGLISIWNLLGSVWQGLYGRQLLLVITICLVKFIFHHALLFCRCQWPTVLDLLWCLQKYNGHFFCKTATKTKGVMFIMNKLEWCSRRLFRNSDLQYQIVSFRYKKLSLWGYLS